MALQHLRSSTANKRPTPGAMSDGQLALNTNLVSPGLFFKDSNGDSVKIGPIHCGATAPNVSPGAGGQAGNSLGEAWLDTSAANPILKVFNGSAFVAVQPVGTGTVVSTTDTGTVTSAMIADGTIVNADINASAAIDKTKVSGTAITAADTGTVTSTMILDGTIVNADVNASAAIAGTKISPDFGSQTVATTGVFSHALGAAATPSITFTGDTNTGIFSPGADQVAVATNGVQRLTVDTAATTSTLPIVHPLGAVGTPSITFTGDLNTGLWSPTADTIAASTGGSERLRIDSSGRVGIGTTSVDTALHVVGAAGSSQLTLTDNTNATLRLGTPTASVGLVSVGSGQSLAFGTQSTPGSTFTERARIDSSGRLLVGTSSARSNFYNTTLTAGLQVESTTHVNRGIALINNSTSTGGGGDPVTLVMARSAGSAIGSNTVVSNGMWLGNITFQGSDGSEFVEAARVDAYVDGTPGANDMPGRLVFSVTSDGSASPTERMRIGNDGTIYFGVTIAPSGSVGGSAFLAESDSRRTLYMASTTTGGTTLAVFRNPNGQVGSITTSGSATAFNTSSDYRLKENVAPVNDGITRLQQLKPSRFNFIVEPGKTVDGFIAHEVQAVVPEAIHGTKDEVDADGNPIYQGIDQSKLVPLLTAALQEAIAKIETLEVRLTALEAQ